MQMPPAFPPVRLRMQVELTYDVRTAGADFIFNIQPARTLRQRVLTESVTVSQGVPLREDLDAATSARLLRLRADAGPLRVVSDATVEILRHEQDPATIGESWLPNIPVHVLPYLYPSRYCESDLLNTFAMKQFGALWQGYGRAQAICDWVQSNVAFTPGSSLGTTSARDTLVQRQGVCRDCAHLMIALCRAINIPARFTTGLDYGADPALGPTDFHAYVEAWLDGRWYIFDPSGTAIPMGFLRLASGRDAADCAYASIFGDVAPTSRSLTIEAIAGADGTVRVPFRSAWAISTDG